jgi:hypothetical protein
MWITPHRLRRAAMLSCVPLAFTFACGDRSTNPANADISGTYSLQSIDGTPLPYTVQDATPPITLVSDVLTVGSDGTWAEAEDFQQVVNGQAQTGSLSDAGTWTRSGASITFFSQVNGVTEYTGTYSDNTLTLDTGDGKAQVFRR